MKEEKKTLDFGNSLSCLHPKTEPVHLWVHTVDKSWQEIVRRILTEKPNQHCGLKHKNYSENTIIKPNNVIPVSSHLLADFSSWWHSSWMYMEPVETCRNDLQWGTVAMPTRKSALLATVLLLEGPASSSSWLCLAFSCSHCPIGSGRYPTWKSFPWHAWMKNILGFPASVGAFWLVKGCVSCWRSTFFSSVPKTLPRSPWDRTQTTWDHRKVRPTVSCSYFFG